MCYQPYFPPENYESSLLRSLSDQRALDVARGFTGRGPHREDFEVLLGGVPVVSVVSLFVAGMMFFVPSFAKGLSNKYNGS